MYKNRAADDGEQQVVPPFVDDNDEHGTDELRQSMRTGKYRDIFKTVNDEHCDRSARERCAEVGNNARRFFSGGKQEKRKGADQKSAERDNADCDHKLQGESVWSFEISFRNNKSAAKMPAMEKSRETVRANDDQTDQRDAKTEQGGKPGVCFFPLFDKNYQKQCCHGKVNACGIKRQEAAGSSADTGSDDPVELIEQRDKEQKPVGSIPSGALTRREESRFHLSGKKSYRACVFHAFKTVLTWKDRRIDALHLP